jgi:hypothetical protein
MWHCTYQYYNLKLYDGDWHVMENVENMCWDDLLYNHQTWRCYCHLGLWCPFAIALVKQMRWIDETTSCCRGTSRHFGTRFESDMKLLDISFNKSLLHLNPWCNFNILGRTTLGSCSHCHRLDSYNTKFVKVRLQFGIVTKKNYNF